MPTKQTELRDIIFKVAQYRNELTDDYIEPHKAYEQIKQLFTKEQDRIRAEVLDEVEQKLPKITYPKNENEAYYDAHYDKRIPRQVRNRTIKEVKSILASLREEGKV